MILCTLDNDECMYRVHFLEMEFGQHAQQHLCRGSDVCLSCLKISPVCFWTLLRERRCEWGEWAGSVNRGASLALRWLATAECLGGWTGGDAVISAAMPLQPSPGLTARSVSPPVTPISRSDHRSPPSLHLRFLPSWAWCAPRLLPDLFGKSSSCERFEEKNIYNNNY